MTLTEKNLDLIDDQIEQAKLRIDNLKKEIDFLEKKVERETGYIHGLNKARNIITQNQKFFDEKEGK